MTTSRSPCCYMWAFPHPAATRHGGAVHILCPLICTARMDRRTAASVGRHTARLTTWGAGTPVSLIYYTRMAEPLQQRASGPSTLPPRTR